MAREVMPCVSQGLLWHQPSLSLLFFTLPFPSRIAQPDKSRNLDFPLPPNGTPGHPSNKLSAYHSRRCHHSTLLFLAIIFSDFWEADCGLLSRCLHSITAPRLMLLVPSSLPPPPPGLACSLNTLNLHPLRCVYLLCVLKVPLSLHCYSELSDSKPDITSPCDIR